jgi:acetylornithine/N-succinyldiaminopimelate aminotransferase
MKELFPPPPPPIVRNQAAAVQELFQKNVVPTYARFELAFSHGMGSSIWDVNGRRYLDLGGGIAVCALGHAHPEIADVLVEQGRRLMHISNLYYHEPQGRLAETLVRLIGPGKCFFCNSGAEANEGLFKLARRFGHEQGRFEIITANNSFHGRTLAGIAATGQEKVKAKMGPAVPGFRHVPFNDLQAVKEALSPATVAVLIEGIQGESGITPARADYLLGLRRLCDEKGLLLLMDEVQSGHFRTGCFQSWQRVLEEVPGGKSFLPDGISMAKSLGGGFPMGAFWVRDRHAELLGPGSHGTTFGGAPLGCAVALKIIEVIERDRLAANARRLGEMLYAGLLELCGRFPKVFQGARGLGLMIGLELAPEVPGLRAPGKPVAAQFVKRLHELGLLAIPAGQQVVRFLPALNLRQDEVTEGLKMIETAAGAVAHPSLPAS